MKHPRTLAALALAGLVAAPLPAAAIDFLWFGGDGDWEHDPNWLPNGVPGLGDSAEIKTGTVNVLQDRSVTRLQMSGGQLQGASLDVLGMATLTGGIVSGRSAIRFLGETEVLGDAKKTFQLGRQVEVGMGATLRWHGNTVDGGNWFYVDGSVLNQGDFLDDNLKSATLGAGILTVFRNEHLYVKSGPGTTTLAARFDNAGTTRVLAGDLLIMYGGTATGTFDIGPAGTLTFSGGSTHTITSGATLAGSGVLRVEKSELRLQGSHGLAGTLFIDQQGLLTLDPGATTTTAAFRQTSGTLSGGNLLVTGAAHWEAGAHRNAGTSEFRGTLLITGDGAKTIEASRRLLVAEGATARWEGNTKADGSGNSIRIDGSSKVRNEGVWEDRNARDARLHPTTSLGSGRFENAGRYLKLGASTTSVGVTFDNTGELRIEAGTMEISSSFDNAGLVDVAAGAVLLADGDTFRNRGRIAGEGTLRTRAGGVLVNEGVIGPGRSIGVLTLDGDLASTAGAVLEISLGASRNDRLDILDDVGFDGTLLLSAAGYAPVLGDSFVVATFDERLGGSTFDAVLASGFGADVGFVVSYGAHDVTVTVSAVPEPATAWLWAAGLGCAAWRRRAAAAATRA